MPVYSNRPRVRKDVYLGGEEEERHCIIPKQSENDILNSRRILLGCSIRKFPWVPTVFQEEGREGCARYGFFPPLEPSYVSVAKIGTTSAGRIRPRTGINITLNSEHERYTLLRSRSNKRGFRIGLWV